ncbi:MAG: Maf family protein [Eubacteriales bacterium]
MTELKIPEDSQVILASKSPRRKELCAQMGLRFTVLTADTPEEVPPGTTPRQAVELLARRKACAAGALAGERDIVIGSDTLVELDGRPLGKPTDRADALRMLLALSGRWHTVHTGVAVKRGARVLVGHDETRVLFRDFDEREARAYVETGEPMDKAGAYGIQGMGGTLVVRTEGAWDTVVGLPTAVLRRLLQEILTERAEAPDEFRHTHSHGGGAV